MSSEQDVVAFRRLTAQHIAIIKPSALGDVVQALPLLSALRRRFPHAQLTWVIQRQLRGLVADHPLLDHVLEVEHRPTLAQAWTTFRELRRSRFDLVLDLQGLARSALMTLATGARWRVGLQTAREGAHLATNLTIPDTGRDVPAHARYWRVAEALGVGDVPRAAWMTVGTGDLAASRQWLSGLPRPIVAVQWGAKWETKRWPIAGFVDVLSQMHAQFGGSVVVVGGQADRSDCEELCTNWRQVTGATSIRNAAGQTSIKQLAALLNAVDLVVSNDSGPLHLAAELGRPTLGIFTCTSPVRSGPPGARHVQVSTQLSCAASYKKICPHHGDQHQACHRELTSARVWSQLSRLLVREGWQPRFQTADELPIAA